MSVDDVPRGELVARTCAMYSTALASGETPSEIVGQLAELYGVQRPAIWRRLISGGLHSPYKSSARRPVRGRRRSLCEIDGEKFDQPRVDRDPCPRCAVRGDIGCNHSRAPLGTIL